MTLSATEEMVAISIRPDLVDEQGVLRYEPGDDVIVDINLQYPLPNGHARVTADRLLVRVQPHASAKPVGVLLGGSEVETWGVVGDWSFVRIGTLRGWSATLYLEPVRAARSDS